jgi:hypothetical protein
MCSCVVVVSVVVADVVADVVVVACVFCVMRGEQESNVLPLNGTRSLYDL